MTSIGQSPPPPSRLSLATETVLKKVDTDGNGVTAAELLKLDTSHETSGLEYLTSGLALRAEGADGILDDAELAKVPEEERAFLRETFARIKSGEIDPNTVVIEFKAPTQSMGQSSYVAPIKRLRPAEEPKQPAKTDAQVKTEIAGIEANPSAHRVDSDSAKAFIKKNGLIAYPAPPPVGGTVYKANAYAPPLLYEKNGASFKFPGVEVPVDLSARGKTVQYQPDYAKEGLSYFKAGVTWAEPEISVGAGAGAVSIETDGTAGGTSVAVGLEEVASVSVAADGTFTIDTGVASISGDLFAPNFGLDGSNIDYHIGPMDVNPATGEFSITVPIPTAPVNGSVTFKGKIEVGSPAYDALLAALATKPG